MRTLILLLLSVPVMAVDCGKGCSEYEGICACEQTPEVAPSIKPDADRVPKDKMPSYQREGIHADMPKSLSDQDAKMDQEKTQADLSGKKAAGLN